jgi:hypothetical protein
MVRLLSGTAQGVMARETGCYHNHFDSSTVPPLLPARESHQHLKMSCVVKLQEGHSRGAQQLRGSKRPHLSVAVMALRLRPIMLAAKAKKS